MAVLGQPLTRSRKPFMPREWFDPSLSHTHRAVEDAMGHAMLLCGMVEASRRGSG